MKTIAFTGHRNYNNTVWVANELYNVITRSINAGYNHFISGMAAGVDQLAVEILMWLDADVKITAAIPFPNQSKRWDKVWQAKYNYLLKHVDPVTISDTYSKGVYTKRDYWVVDNAEVVIAVLDDRLASGTRLTAKYALKQGKPVYRINPNNQTTAWVKELL